jgi:hypothetical protein
MEFEWDPGKASANVRCHGVEFADAIRIFSDFVLLLLDTRGAYGEDRWVATGFADARELVVVYKTHGAMYRLISARRATRREREAYWQARGGRKN